MVFEHLKRYLTAKHGLSTGIMGMQDVSSSVPFLLSLSASPANLPRLDSSGCLQTRVLRLYHILGGCKIVCNDAQRVQYEIVEECVHYLTLIVAELVRVP